MAALPIAPGQVYIEVEYDYEYKSRDRLVSIQQGDCFMLVKKTNEDWWQVRKEDGSKAFYVPAQYVREVRKALMPPKAPAPAAAATGSAAPHGGGALWVKPSSGQQPADPDQLDHKGRSSLPRTRARSPDPVRAPLDVDRAPRCDSAGEERRTNDSESGDELSSSSTEHLQMVSPSGESPVSTHLPEVKVPPPSLPPLPSGPPLHLLGDWETFRDQTGRLFYYNRCTQERSWKPPRARESGGSESTPLSLSPSILPFLSSLSIGGSLEDVFPGRSGRSGWSEEVDDRGHRLYISDYTKEKWLKHVDQQGRPYFYSADGSRSEWELPKYSPSPPQPGDAPKCRSLDRRQVEPIVLTKWRHSAHVLEPGDKEAPLDPASPSAESEEAGGPSSPKPPTSPSEKCGVLNVTKITEHGKKVRKNWTSSWTVLQGSTLLFAKVQGGGTSWFGGGQSKPEFLVDLRGGSVDWASRDKSSKKHVIEVKTRQDTELLIQSDNEGQISEWYRALQDAASNQAWESDEAVDEEAPESPVLEKSDKEHRDSKKSRAMKTSSSMDGSDNKKTRHKLKKFLTRRPTLQSVRDRGYIKDQVFGCTLSSLCVREGGSVPSFVSMCIDHVENNGLCVDGLYRVSGNLAVIQKLRFAVNHDEKVNLEDRKWEDIHVTTGALKMFFRELPEPLFSYGLFHRFISSIKIPDYKHRVQAIRDLVNQLPKPNHDTMQALLKHLRKVIDHGEENRMTTQSVAIVFGPTLLRPETETWNMAVHMVYQNQIVELILLEYDNIFVR